MLEVGLAFLVTLAIAAGIYGLGDLTMQRNGIGVRWVFGWSLLWWIVALPAQLAGPDAGIPAGAAAIVVGCVRLTLRWRDCRRQLIAGCVAALAGSPLWLAPPHFYDALVYHLGLPWSWLVNGSFAPVENNLFSHFPLAGSTVYLLAVRAGAPEAAAGLHWLTFAAVLATATELARLLGAGRWSWIAAVLLCGCWHAPWLASLAGADHLVVLGVLVAVVLWMTPGEENDRPWAATGIALGFALSSKYTAAVPVAGFLVAAAAMCRPRWQAVAAGAVALLASSFWWVRNLIDVGNPFHPLLWNVFDGPGWTREEYARYVSLVRESVGDAWSWMTPLGVWFAPAAIVALATLFSRRAEAPRVRFVGLAAVLALAGWVATSQTARYALPAAALVAALGAAGAAQLPRWALGVTLGGFGLAVAHGIFTLGLFLFDSLGIQETWAGRESREAWRHGVTLNDPAPAYRAADGLEPDARILIVGEGRPWQCPRPHQTSSPYDTQWLQEAVERAASADDVRRAVLEAGFTHLLINWAELNRLGGEDYRMLRWKTPADLARYRDFGMQMTERIWTEGPLEIRAIYKTRP